MNISKYNNEITIDYLLDTKESIYFERKSFGITPSKLANSIIAMANAEGGVIVVGIKNGKIEDLDLDSVKYNDFFQVGINYIKPPCDFQTEEITYDGRNLILFHISPDYERLFCRKDTEDIYLRIGDETRKLNRDEVRKLEYDKVIRKYEDELEDFDENDFDMDIVNMYKDKIIKYNGDFRDLLVNKYLAIKRDGKYLYKKSAILLFAKDPEKYIPSASVRYVRYNGKSLTTGTKLNIIKDERFFGPIPTLIEATKSFLKNVLRDYYFLDIDKGKFIKIPEYPEEAWLEGIVNALTHRSYNLQGNVVLIKHYDDRLEISNSGPLPTFVTIENIERNRYARNPRIARVLADFGYVRELNEGVKRIFESMKKFLLTKPEYKDENNIVTLVLKNSTISDNRVLTEQKRLLIEKELPHLQETSRNIILILSQNNGLSVKDISAITDISERTIREHLKKLYKRGLIQRHSNKNRDPDAMYSL